MAAERPEDLDSLLEAAMAAGDVEALVELYEPCAVFADEGIKKMVGREQLVEGFTRLAGQHLRIRGNPRVVADFGDLAVLYNDWTETGAGADGASFARSGKAIEIVRKQTDGTWRYLFDDPYGRG